MRWLLSLLFPYRLPKAWERVGMHMADITKGTGR